MNNLNPIAVIFWAFCALLGFIISGNSYGASIGLTAGLGITLVVSLL